MLSHTYKRQKFSEWKQVQVHNWHKLPKELTHVPSQTPPPHAAEPLLLHLLTVVKLLLTSSVGTYRAWEHQLGHLPLNSLLIPLLSCLVSSRVVWRKSQAHWLTRFHFPAGVLFFASMLPILHHIHLLRCLGDIFEIDQSPTMAQRRTLSFPPQAPTVECPVCQNSGNIHSKQSDKIQRVTATSWLMLALLITLPNVPVVFERKVDRWRYATDPVSLSQSTPLHELLPLWRSWSWNCDLHTFLDPNPPPPTPLSLLQQISVRLVGAHPWKNELGSPFLLAKYTAIAATGHSADFFSPKKLWFLSGTGLS